MVPRDPNAPADTRMMRIVHQALRRDLERARLAVLGSPPPDAPQRAAIAGHLAWMMSFLEAHHRSEDAGLYPVVRERRPDALPLLDDMAADHEAVAAAMIDVEHAVAAYADRDDRAALGTALVTAIDGLEAVLLPHLDREEREAMPVVSSVVTNAEWDAIEQAQNLDGKSFRQLGYEGHWLIDDVTPEDRAVVLGLVPWLPRMLVLYGLGPSYRRRARRCWDPRPRRRVQKSGSTAVLVDADIGAVWAVVRDVTRVGEWSHECVGCTWLGDATDAVPGARFRGKNRQRIFTWGRVCEVVRAEPYELVYRTVPTTVYPDSTEWSIRLTRVGGQTRIEQTFAVVKAPKVLDRVYAVMVPAHRDRTDALNEDLRRLGRLASSAPARVGDQVAG